MKFSELKEKYSEVDIAKENLDTLIIKDFIFKESGDICLSSAGFSVESNYLSVYVHIAKNRTPKQMDMFIRSLGD